MSKQTKALKLSLALLEFAKKLESGELDRYGWLANQFAFEHEFRTFKNAEEVRKLANKIAKSRLNS